MGLGIGYGRNDGPQCTARDGCLYDDGHAGECSNAPMGRGDMAARERAKEEAERRKNAEAAAARIYLGPPTVHVDDAIAILNQLVALDQDAMRVLVGRRVDCNRALADHPTAQVLGYPNGTFAIGLLGVINAIFGVDGKDLGFIAAEFSEDGTLLGFARSKS